MDRDKRRSKEDEEELDRKIALIREKNQKIEQRSKEIEADRVNHTDVEPKKSPQSPESVNGQPSSKKGADWSREWDHGKTPADSWRENVPSLELSGRLAGRGGAQNNRPRPPRNEPSKGSRLECRVSMDNDVRGGRGKGRGEGRKEEKKKDERSVQRQDGQLKISIRNIEASDAQKKNNAGGRNNNRRNPAKTSQGEKAATPENEHKEKSTRPPRQRRESDNYVIKTVLRKVIDRVEQKEKAEKRREQRQLEGAEAEKQGKDDVIEEAETEGKDDVIEERQEGAETERSNDVNEKTNVEEVKKDDVTVEKEEERESTVAEEVADKKQEVTNDANQNVITLAKEKVLTVEMST